MATPVCRLASRRATYGPYRPHLDGPFRRAKNGPSQMRRPAYIPYRFIRFFLLILPFVLLLFLLFLFLHYFFLLILRVLLLALLQLIFPLLILFFLSS